MKKTLFSLILCCGCIAMASLPSHAKNGDSAIRSREESPDFAPETLDGKTITLQFNNSIAYLLSRIDGGWNSPNMLIPDHQKLVQIIKIKKSTAIIPQYLTGQLTEFYTKKIGINSITLTTDPNIEDENVEESTEHTSTYQFYFTSKNGGIATIIMGSYAGESIETNISFTLSNS